MEESDSDDLEDLWKDMSLAMEYSKVICYRLCYFIGIIFLFEPKKHQKVMHNQHNRQNNK